MSLIDEIIFHARAGRGGNGVVRWRHEKGKEFSGAAGGNAGRGGDVYVRAVRDLNILGRYRAVKEFASGNGEDGRNSSKHGRNGEDCFVDLPIGSIITNLESGRTVELLSEGQTEKILHGGRGGLGNEHFKASTNVRPEQSTEGQAGESADFRVELNLIADIGFVGLPNAGKSSLLNALTESRAKVGNYAFTTLDPNLGVLPGGYVVADIPGLIEGASEGKGLGHKFLRHVKRTRFLTHLVAVDVGLPTTGNQASEPVNIKELVGAYKTVRNELCKYDQAFLDKPEVVLLTKTDLLNKEEVKKLAKNFQKEIGKEVFAVSVLDDEAVKKLAELLVVRTTEVSPR